MTPKTCQDFTMHLTCKMPDVWALLRSSPDDCDCGACCVDSLPAFGGGFSSDALMSEQPSTLHVTRLTAVVPLVLVGAALGAVIARWQRARQPVMF